MVPTKLPSEKGAESTIAALELVADGVAEPDVPLDAADLVVPLDAADVAVPLGAADVGVPLDAAVEAAVDTGTLPVPELATMMANRSRAYGKR